MYKGKEYKNALQRFFCRIDLKSLMFLMKFVYFYADKDDVKKLYHLIKQAQSSIPLKPFDQIQTSTVLGQPLAISNYLKGLNPLDKMGEKFCNEN